jgi:hypothetical protein
MFSSWYVVDETNNSFNLTRCSDQHVTTIELATGNYPYKTLYQNINTIFGKNICNWDKVKNKLYFTFTVEEPYALSFNNKSYELLGFNNSTYAGSMIESENVLNPLFKMDTICLNIYGINPYRTYNIDNMNGKEMKVSSLLMAIPFNGAPYDVFTWTNVNSEYKLFVYDKEIQQLRFVLTDFDGNELDFLPDFTFTLKVDTNILESEDKTLQTLERILEYTRLSFIAQNIK